MTVKWVCGNCGSNNMAEKSVIMQCSICSTLRTTETLIAVDTNTINPATTVIPNTEVHFSQDTIWQLILIYYTRLLKILSICCVISMLIAFALSAFLFFPPSSKNLQHLEENVIQFLHRDHLSRLYINFIDFVTKHFDQKSGQFISNNSDYFLTKAYHFSNSFSRIWNEKMIKHYASANECTLRNYENYIVYTSRLFQEFNTTRIKFFATIKKCVLEYSSNLFTNSKFTLNRVGSLLCNVNSNLSNKTIPAQELIERFMSNLTKLIAQIRRSLNMT